MQSQVLCLAYLMWFYTGGLFTTNPQTCYFRTNVALRRPQILILLRQRIPCFYTAYKTSVGNKHRLAWRAGFEPADPVSRVSSLAGKWFKPLTHRHMNYSACGRYRTFILWIFSPVRRPRTPHRQINRLE